MRVGNIVGDQRNFHSERCFRLIRIDKTARQIGSTKLMSRKSQGWRCTKLVQPQKEKDPKIIRPL